MTEFNFGPKTDEEKEIFAREAARVDREVADYEAALTGDKIAKIKVFYRNVCEQVADWFHYRIRSIRFFRQRLTRGFDDSATWSLDIHLAGL